MGIKYRCTPLIPGWFEQSAPRCHESVQGTSSNPSIAFGSWFEIRSAKTSPKTSAYAQGWTENPRFHRDFDRIFYISWLSLRGCNFFLMDRFYFLMHFEATRLICSFLQSYAIGASVAYSHPPSRGHLSAGILENSEIYHLHHPAKWVTSTPGSLDCNIPEKVPSTWKYCTFETTFSVISRKVFRVGRYASEDITASARAFRGYSMEMCREDYNIVKHHTRSAITEAPHMHFELKICYW